VGYFLVEGGLPEVPPLSAASGLWPCDAREVPRLRFIECGDA
jgi:hypothetical protein